MDRLDNSRRRDLLFPTIRGTEDFSISPKAAYNPKVPKILNSSFLPYENPNCPFI